MVSYLSWAGWVLLDMFYGSLVGYVLAHLLLLNTHYTISMVKAR